MTDLVAIDLRSLVNVTGGASEPKQPNFPPVWDCSIDPKTGKWKCKRYPGN